MYTCHHEHFSHVVSTRVHINVAFMAEINIFIVSIFIYFSFGDTGNVLTRGPVCPVVYTWYMSSSVITSDFNKLNHDFIKWFP